MKSILPDVFVSASSDVVNTIREYERFSSAAMNAYIGPKTSAYLRNLESRLRANGIKAMIRIMQSNGGISTIENSSELPIGLLLSGPAGGVIGGRWTGEHCGKDNVITIDIGGTSADISVIEGGELRIKNPRDTEVAGLPVLVPMIDIDAIGAGGGSIAYIDPGGAFRVGPRSAGAVPGPACYAKGGEEPTVTDAQVVLGRMDPEHFLGGDLKIDASLSEKAIRKHIAEPLNLSLEDAALGILKIINNNMALAINANSVAKGVDPRNFSLMGFGGAGPLHSVSLAEAIYAKDVISPVHPGITAATGLLVTDLQYEYTQSTLMVLNDAGEEEFGRVNAVIDDLIARANRQLDADGIPARQRIFRQVAECRYVGQGFELRAEAPEGRLGKDSAAAVIENFYNAHKQVYGHAFRDQLTEMVTLRVIATVAVDTLRLPKLAKGGRKIRRRPYSIAAAPCSTVARRSRRRAMSAASCSRTIRSPDRRWSSSTIPRPSCRPAMLRPCWNTATCASSGKSGERHGETSRSHHAAGHRRSPAFHRRADGQRSLPHELFVDHPREPGSRRRPVRPRLQHALRDPTRRRCISARCPAICAASRRPCRSTPGSRATASCTTIPITAPAIRPTSASSCRSFMRVN